MNTKNGLYPSVRELLRGRPGHEGWYSIVVKRGDKEASWLLIGNNGKRRLAGRVMGEDPVELGHREAKLYFDHMLEHGTL